MSLDDMQFIEMFFMRIVYIDVRNSFYIDVTYP